jgi:hypothetical protein
MNLAWATSLDQLSRSPAFPMWVTLAAAGFFGFVVLIAMLRADKSAANGALTIITLLAVGVAIAATIERFNAAGGGAMPREMQQGPATNIAMPALACVDDLAGDTVLAACEKDLFGSAETVAAAVRYAATQVERLTTYGDVAIADQDMTPELMSLRQAVERDRYGLVAHVLTERYRCTPSDCAVFRALSNRRQIVANMDARTYDGLIARYASSWNTPQMAGAPTATVASTAAAPGTAPAAPLGPVQGTLMPAQGPLGASMLVGRPTNAEFPTAASTPPVSIMTPEPGTGTRPPAASKTTPPPAATAPAPPTTAAIKKPAPKPARPAAAQAPVQISPEASAPPAVARE